MRILYAESTAYHPSSAHFLEALRGHAAKGESEYRFVDEASFLGTQRSLVQRVAHRLIGGRPVGCGALNRTLLKEALEYSPDVVLVGKGSWYSPRTLREIADRTNAMLVNWATDDPFNPADSTADLVKSIPLYDLYVCTKEAIMDDVAEAGCRNVAYVRFGYKPEVHYPQCPVREEEQRRFGCDVVFVGGADRDRVEYVRLLMRKMRGLRLNLFGGYWNRYPELRRYWRGFANGEAYRLALGGAAIALCFVRHANRDDHVMRTFEIPACGAFMLAERTSTHDGIFVEGKEAAFFSSGPELVEKVSFYIQREEERRRIAAAGRRRVLAGRHTYADRLGEILSLVRGIEAGRSGRRCARSTNHGGRGPGVLSGEGGR